MNIRRLHVWAATVAFVSTEIMDTPHFVVASSHRGLRSSLGPYSPEFRERWVEASIGMGFPFTGWLSATKLFSRLDTEDLAATLLSGLRVNTMHHIRELSCRQASPARIGAPMPLERMWGTRAI